LSYILDAIKKAEKQRNRGQISTLESAVTYQDSPKTKSRFWIKISACVVILIFTLLYFFKEPVLIFISQQISKTVRPESQSTGEAQNRLSQESANEPNEDLQQETNQSIYTVQNFANFSQQTQQRLKQISFSVISYSKDSRKRFVMFGAEILRQGDEVNGFKILAIEKDGVALEVEGQIFLLGL